MATSGDRNEWIDSDTGDMFYLDDNGNLRRMNPLPKAPRLFSFRSSDPKPFKASAVPDTLKEWVTGEKA